MKPLALSLFRHRRARGSQPLMSFSSTSFPLPIIRPHRPQSPLPRLLSPNHSPNPLLFLRLPFTRRTNPLHNSSLQTKVMTGLVMVMEELDEEVQLAGLGLVRDKGRTVDVGWLNGMS